MVPFLCKLCSVLQGMQGLTHELIRQLSQVNLLIAFNAQPAMLL